MASGRQVRMRVIGRHDEIVYPEFLIGGEPDEVKHVLADVATDNHR
jgi:hypothetical protein